VRGVGGEPALAFVSRREPVRAGLDPGAPTETVVWVALSAAVSPHEAWRQPILRFADTIIGVAVGVAAAWVDLRVIRPWVSRTWAEAGERQP
jgi:uncharacterized membrane protein YccC